MTHDQGTYYGYPVSELSYRAPPHGWKRVWVRRDDREGVNGYVPTIMRLKRVSAFAWQGHTDGGQRVRVAAIKGAPTEFVTLIGGYSLAHAFGVELENEDHMSAKELRALLEALTQFKKYPSFAVIHGMEIEE